MMLLFSPRMGSTQTRSRLLRYVRVSTDRMSGTSATAATPPPGADRCIRSYWAKRLSCAGRPYPPSSISNMFSHYGGIHLLEIGEGGYRIRKGVLQLRHSDFYCTYINCRRACGGPGGGHPLYLGARPRRVFAPGPPVRGVKVVASAAKF